MLRTLISFAVFAVVTAGATDPASELTRARELAAGGQSSAARTAFQALAHDATIDARSRSLALSEMSRIDLAAGHYPDAIREGSESAQLAVAGKDRATEGGALTATGLAYLYSGDYASALRDLETSLACARDTHDVASEITRLNNVGNVYYYQGRYTEALAEYEMAQRAVDASSEEKLGERIYRARLQLTAANIATVYQRLGQYNRALDIYAGLKSASNAMRPAEQAQLLANMGALYRRLGDPVKALEIYRAARALYKDNQQRSGEIAVLNNIGIAQALDLHRYPEARASFDEALTMARATGDKPVALHALLYRGQTDYRQARFADAARDFADALQASIELKAVEEQWKALYGLARLDRDAGRHLEARRRLEEAIGLIESLRGNVVSTSLRGGFLADKREVYDLAIAEALDGGAPDAGRIFHYMEQSRARTLQDKPGAAIRSLDDVRKSVPEDSVLLEYWSSEEGMALLWAARDSAGVTPLSGGPGFRPLLNKLAARLADPANGDWREPAQAVGDILFGAAARGRRRLIVAADNELWKIPFEALIVDGRPLVDRYNISYGPAGSLVRAVENRRSVRMPWQRSLVGFANPVAGNGSADIQLPGANNTAGLPGAEQELRIAARLLGGSGDLMLGAQAAKRGLAKAGSRTLPVLHLATHAWADPEDPTRSWMLFAPATPGAGFDYLFLKEAAGLNLRGVSLVTASACETEVGRLQAGEGVESFGRAFLEAGADAVVTSLWPVSDRGTAHLMSRFYRRLGQGMEAGEALSQARRELAGTTHPALWAAFVLSGNTAVRMPYFVKWYQLAAAALTLAALAAALFGFRRRAGRA